MDTAADGVLQLAVPKGVAEADREVEVTIESVAAGWHWRGNVCHWRGQCSPPSKACTQGDPKAANILHAEGAWLRQRLLAVKDGSC